jgi:hypothetical protein
MILAWLLGVAREFVSNVIKELRSGKLDVTEPLM